MNERLFLLTFWVHSSSSQLQATTERVCGEDINYDAENTTGVIFSPGWPDEYPPNIQCTWRIFAPVQVNITIKIESIAMESNDW